MTKLDIAGIHVRSAILMILQDVSPVSVHVLVMAAEEMIKTIAAKRGVFLPFELDNSIKPEHREEVRRIQRRRYNWFKHANRDTDEIFDGASISDIDISNDLQTLANLHSLTLITKEGYGEVGAAFIAYMASSYEELFDVENMAELMPHLHATFVGFKGASKSQMKTDLRFILRSGGHLAD